MLINNDWKLYWKVVGLFSIFHLQIGLVFDVTIVQIIPKMLNDKLGKLAKVLD